MPPLWSRHHAPPADRHSTLVTAPGNGRALVTDDELQQAVKVAIDTALAEGADYITQTQRAVKADLELRPEITADAALWFVKRVRR